MATPPLGLRTFPHTSRVRRWRIPLSLSARCLLIATLYGEFVLSRLPAMNRRPALPFPQVVREILLVSAFGTVEISFLAVLTWSLPKPIIIYMVTTIVITVATKDNAP